MADEGGVRRSKEWKNDGSQRGERNSSSERVLTADRSDCRVVDGGVDEEHGADSSLGRGVGGGDAPHSADNDESADHEDEAKEVE